MGLLEILHLDKRNQVGFAPNFIKEVEVLVHQHPVHESSRPKTEIAGLGLSSFKEMQKMNVEMETGTNCFWVSRTVLSIQQLFVWILTIFDKAENPTKIEIRRNLEHSFFFSFPLLTNFLSKLHLTVLVVCG